MDIVDLSSKAILSVFYHLIWLTEQACQLVIMFTGRQWQNVYLYCLVEQVSVPHYAQKVHF